LVRAAPAQRRVDFDLKSGLHANDASRVAKKEHLKPLEAELVKLEGMADDILKSFEYLQEREAEHRNTNGEHLQQLANCAANAVPAHDNEPIAFDAPSAQSRPTPESSGLQSSRSVCSSS
jgi:hypothetical protein